MHQKTFVVTQTVDLGPLPVTKVVRQLLEVWKGHDEQYLLQWPTAVDEDIAGFHKLLARLEIVHRDMPLCRVLVPLGVVDTMSKLDILPQIVLVDQTFEVVENLGTFGIVLAPDVRCPCELIAG